jgi:hypothetical protein
MPWPRCRTHRCDVTTVPCQYPPGYQKVFLDSGQSHLRSRAKALGSLWQEGD